MKLLKIASIAFVCFFFFAFGLVTRHYETSLYMFIHDTYRTVKSNDPAVLAEFSIDPTEISQALADVSGNVVDTRNRLKERVILPPEIVRISEKEVSENKYELSAKLYGIEVTTGLNKTPCGNSTCLRMYVQGHGGDPFSYDYHNDILKASL